VEENEVRVEARTDRKTVINKRVRERAGATGREEESKKEREERERWFCGRARRQTKRKAL
jgi:hypothetical protein